MNAIREFHTVGEDKTIKISIPDDFNATEVEVIVLPKRTDYIIDQETQNLVLERRAEYLKNPEKAKNIDDLLDELEKDL